MLLNEKESDPRECSIVYVSRFFHYRGDIKWTSKREVIVIPEWRHTQNLRKAHPTSNEIVHIDVTIIIIIITHFE